MGHSGQETRARRSLPGPDAGHPRRGAVVTAEISIRNRHHQEARNLAFIRSNSSRVNSPFSSMSASLASSSTGGTDLADDAPAAPFACAARITPSARDKSIRSRLGVTLV